MKRHIIIGDVHGCSQELQALLDKVGLTKQDTLVFVGDLVDKGPDSIGVLRIVRKLRLQGHNVVYVLGNHEEKHLRWIRNEATAKETGRKNKMTPRPDMTEITAQYDDVDRALLQTAVLFYEGDDFLVVHAGVPANLSELNNHFFRTLHGKRKKKWGRLLRLRFEDPQGRMVRLGHETDADKYWAEKYDGRFGHVFFGHQAFLQDDPKYYDNATGLDLGCCYGNKLCAAVIDNSDPLADLEDRTTFVTVDALEAYSQSYSVTHGVPAPKAP